MLRYRVAALRGDEDMFSLSLVAEFEPIQEGNSLVLAPPNAIANWIATISHSVRAIRSGRITGHPEIIFSSIAVQKSGCGKLAQLKSLFVPQGVDRRCSMLTANDDSRDRLDD